MRPRAALFGSLLGIVVGVACSDDDEALPPIPPPGTGGEDAGSTLDAAADASDADAPVPPDPFGGFDVAVEDGNRLVIRAADGRVLLDGLAPSADPDRTGFATREVETRYEMMFGSFKPTEIPWGDWQVAQSLERSELEDGARIDLVDGGAVVLASLSIRGVSEGHLEVAVEPGAVLDRRLRWAFACEPDDHFAGFGAQTWDVDHRGQTVPTWVQEEGIGKIETDTYDDVLWYMAGRRHSSHLPIPQFLARRGYILTAETDARSIFALCSDQSDVARLEVEMPLTVHLFDGPSPREAIERATATFGRPRMPPRVAFAPWLDALHGSDSVRSVAYQARDRGIPASVMWVEDWRGGEQDMLGGYKLREEWDVDTTLYPDLAALSDELHDLGYAFLIYFNPFVFEQSRIWDEAADGGHLIRTADGEPYTFLGATLVDRTSMVDLTSPAAWQWAKGKMEAALALGVDGWMADFAEWLPTDAVLAAGSGLEQHNRYPVLWQELSREVLDQASDEAPKLFFARSGWFGTPPVADVIWAGDQRTDLQRDDGMPIIIPIGIGLGVVGVSTYGHDIGGYNSSSSPPSTREVFYRWTELGAWTPVMRTHHGNYPDDNWRWNRDEETIALFRRYAELHVSLVPYWEALAREAADHGMPIWRGLALEFPEDEDCWPIDDQVMIGSGVLVAPVQVAGAISREVYLPAGRWYPWDGGSPIAGPTTITVDAPMEEIPVLARAGAIVPAYPTGVMTLFNGSTSFPDDSAVGEDRVVRVFLGASGELAESGALRYELEQLTASSAGPFDYRWDDAAVSACGTVPAAPCVDAEAGLATLVLEGPGELAVSDASDLVARVRLVGGSATRRTELRLRY